MPLRGLAVLVVEDDRDHRELARDMLPALGAQVTVATLAASLGLLALEPRAPQLQLLHRWLDSSRLQSRPAANAWWRRRHISGRTDECCDTGQRGVVEAPQSRYRSRAESGFVHRLHR